MEHPVTMSGWLELALAHIAAYLNDDEYADLDDVARASTAIDRARALLPPEPPDYPNVSIDGDGLPVCECGSREDWKEFGKTVYSQRFDGASWLDYETFVEGDVPEFVQCAVCEREYNSSTFPRPN